MHVAFFASGSQQRIVCKGALRKGWVWDAPITLSSTRHLLLSAAAQGLSLLRILSYGASMPAFSSLTQQRLTQQSHSAAFGVRKVSQLCPYVASHGLTFDQAATGRVVRPFRPLRCRLYRQVLVLG